MSTTDAVCEVEVLVMVDADGNWELGSNMEDLKTRWQDNIGELEPNASRLVRVKVKVKVPRPQPINIEAEVEEENNEATVSVQ